MDSNPDKIRSKNECIDRISSLPDSILGQILSYLPTKHAVATSILSTKWKHIFPFIVPPIKLDLDDSQLVHPEKNESNPPSSSFTGFVDRLLNETLLDVPCVDKLALKCQKGYGDDKIVSWVVSVVRLNVRQLIFRSFLDDSENFFHTLNGCKSLVKLVLGRDFDLYLTGDFTLPNLKILHLVGLQFYPEYSVHELLEGCPLLEDLMLNCCDTSELFGLFIQAPLLKSLFIEDCWKDVVGCELMIDAPNLEVLLYNDCTAPDYSFRKFKSLLAVHIDVGPSTEQIDEADYHFDEGLLHLDRRVGELVTACSSTCKLFLAGCTIAALQRSLVELPIFENLTSLALGYMGTDGWKLLARLLLSAPNLKSLKIEEGFKEYEGGFASFELLLPSLPVCLELKLVKIEFWVFEGEEDNEMRLIEYFLKNGKVLQKIEVRCLPCDDTSILMRLFMFPRHSKTCRIFLRPN